MPSISGDVFVELLSPEIDVGPRRRRRFTTMAVPETAMYEQHRLKSGEDDIGRSRQALVVKSVSQSDFVQRLSKLHLRPGILLPDLGHDFRTRRFVHGIHQASSTFSMTFVEIRASRCRWSSNGSSPPLTRTPSSMLRSIAAEVRFALVMKASSPSATAHLA